MARATTDFPLSAKYALPGAAEADTIREASARDSLSSTAKLY
jgi:hypothetical protein